MTARYDLRDVRLAYGDTAAVDGISLAIEGPGIVGLLGRNGSGKSSLLSLMAAFRKPDSGEVLLDGEPVWENASRMSRIALIREGGDVVDEDEKLDEALRYAAWLRPTWNADLADRLIDDFHVPRKRKLNEMSRGQRSAVGVALGLAARTPVTMFDETYLGMDAPTRVRFYDVLLREAMEHPRLFVLSTHLIDEVSRILQEVIVIDRGNVLLQSATDDLLGQGMTVTGNAERVDAFVAGLTVIGQRDLGRTRSVTVFGGFDDARLRDARSQGLDLDPVDLQDLFVHLTDPDRTGVPR